MHREREGDAELEHVAPRPAPDHDRARQHRGPEGEPGDERDADRRLRERARRGEGRRPGRGGALLARRRTSRSRRRRRPAATAGIEAGIVRRPLASITAWPTKAANPMAISRVPTLNSAEDSWGSTSGDRGAAGLRPGAGADRDRARDDLEDEAAVGAGVDDGGAAQVAHRADHRELVLAGVAAGRARRVDERIAAAVGQALREDREPAGIQLGDARPLFERDLARAACGRDRPSSRAA